MKTARMVVSVVCDCCHKTVDREIDLMTCNLLDGDIVTREIASEEGFYILNNGDYCNECYDSGEYMSSSDDFWGEYDGD